MAISDGFRCASCGVWVYPHQVHNCYRIGDFPNKCSVCGESYYGNYHFCPGPKPSVIPYVPGKIASKPVDENKEGVSRQEVQKMIDGAMKKLRKDILRELRKRAT